MPTHAEARTLTAMVAGVCCVCGKRIETGGSFVWADGLKNRAHPTCLK